MAEPVADRHEINSGTEQVDRRRMTIRVGMDALGRQTGRERSCLLCVPAEEVADAKARQCFAAMILEDASRPRSDAGQDPERVDGLAPQWAEPFFATFAAKPNERRSLKVEITGLDVEQLLHAGAGIEQREQ